jgi:hypothetical protein
MNQSFLYSFSSIRNLTTDREGGNGEEEMKKFIR